MNTLIINLQQAIKLQELDYLLNAITVHTDFYCDKSPELIKVSGDSLLLKLNRNLNDEEQEYLRESIEIDIPIVQISFTDKF